MFFLYSEFFLILCIQVSFFVTFILKGEKLYLSPIIVYLTQRLSHFKPSVDLMFLRSTI